MERVATLRRNVCCGLTWGPEPACDSGRSWIRTRDLILIRDAL
jgi:hypothetical protein